MFERVLEDKILLKQWLAGIFTFDFKDSFRTESLDIVKTVVRIFVCIFMNGFSTLYPDVSGILFRPCT